MENWSNAEVMAVRPVGRCRSLESYADDSGSGATFRTRMLDKNNICMTTDVLLLQHVLLLIR